MGNRSRFMALAAIGLAVAGLFLVLLVPLTGIVRAPTVDPAAPVSAPAEAPVDGRDAFGDDNADSSDPVADGAAPAELVETAKDLQAAYEERKELIPDEVAEPLDENIGIVEGAVADLMAAIADDPDNDSLKRMLIATYRNEVKLLKKALHLTGGPDEEEAEEEAPTH